MPKDPTSKQRFISDPWAAPTTSTDAGKVWLSGVASGVSIGISPTDTASRAQTNLSGAGGTAWATIVDVGAGVGVELRYYGIGDRTTSTSVKFRFGSGSSWSQPLAAKGGAFNANLIGCYERGGLGNDLQVRLSTQADCQVTVRYKTY